MRQIVYGLVVAIAAAAIGSHTTSGSVVDLRARSSPEAEVQETRDDQELFCDDGSGETGIYSPAENWYGNLLELPCDVALLKSVRFTHYGFGFTGPYDYNLHVLDVGCSEIYEIPGLTALNAAGTPVEEVVDLESYDICVEGDFMVMIEPQTCADPPSDQNCYPSMLLDLSPGGDPNAACSRIRLPTGQCVQFTVGGSYANYLLRATVECDAPICLGTPDTMAVGSAIVDPGAAGVEIPVSLVNSIPVGGFEFVLEYDPVLIEAVGVNRTERTEDFEIFGVNLEPGTVTVVAIADFVGGDDIPPMPVGSGPIANVVFDVDCVDMAEAEMFPLNLQSASISDSSGMVYIATVNVDGSLTVREGECGTVCCFEDGSCLISDETGCTDLGGEWIPIWHTCDPNPCPLPPTCSVDPTSIDFGTVEVGSSADSSFSITNTGGGTLLGTVSASCDHYSVISGGGAYSLGAEQSLTVTVRFEPDAEGVHICTIETGNDLCGSVSCTGEAEDLSAVMLQEVWSSWEGDHVEITWVLPELDPTLQLTFAISRVRGSNGSTERINAPDVIREASRFTFRDRSIEPDEIYTYRISIFSESRLLVSFGVDLSTPLSKLTLYQNQPNPVNGSTQIRFSMPLEGHVRLGVYDIAGQRMRTLVDHRKDAGRHSSVWDGCDDNGRPVASGAYFYRLEVGGELLARTFTLLR